jgi:hypothetical protein
MPRTVDQVEDAWLEGSIDFDEFIQKFEVDFMKPVELRFQKMMWASLSDADKELLKALAPDAYEEVEKAMEV